MRTQKFSCHNPPCTSCRWICTRERIILKLQKSIKKLIQTFGVKTKPFSYIPASPRCTIIRPRTIRRPFYFWVNGFKFFILFVKHFLRLFLAGQQRLRRGKSGSKPAFFPAGTARGKRISAGGWTFRRDDGKMVAAARAGGRGRGA